MTEVVTLILSNVCGAAIVLSLRRRTTDRRRRPTAPEAPSTFGRSGTPNEEAHRRLAADLDGRGAGELRDPQQTSHSMPRGLGRPVACSADGRLLTDQLVAWHGPDRTPQPASEASGTPRHSASAHSARRLDRSRAKLVCSAERPSFAGDFTPLRPRRLPPPSPPPSPPAARYRSLRDHIPLFLLIGFLCLVVIGLFLALALTAPPTTSFSPPPAPIWHSPSPPPPSPGPPPPPSPTAQAATAAPGWVAALSPPELTRDDGSAAGEARRPADDPSPWWWRAQGQGARSQPRRPGHASPNHVGYVVVGGLTGAALALSSIRLRPRTRPAAASAAADALAAAAVVQGAAETLGDPRRSPRTSPIPRPSPSPSPHARPSSRLSSHPSPNPSPHPRPHPDPTKACCTAAGARGGARSSAPRWRRFSSHPSCRKGRCRPRCRERPLWALCGHGSRGPLWCAALAPHRPLHRSRRNLGRASPVYP